VVGQLVWSGFEVPLFAGQEEMGETGETGEDFDLFSRRMPAFNGTELNSVTALRSKLERRIKNNILTGLTVSPVSQIVPPALLSGYQSQETPRSELSHYVFVVRINILRPSRV
jgi:hypothetical protein